MTDDITIVFDALAPGAKKMLLAAREHGREHFEEYEPGSYIGVYAERLPFLVPQRIKGPWSIGSVDHGGKAGTSMPFLAADGSGGDDGSSLGVGRCSPLGEAGHANVTHQ